MDYTPADIRKINIGRLNWLDSLVKIIEKKHPGVNMGFEKDSNTHLIISKKGTVLISINLDVQNNYIIYSYLADVGGKMISERTKDINDLRLIIPKLEEIDAFNK